MPEGTELVALTVAVKVTAWANTEGLGDEVNVVVVARGLTTWEREGEVLPWKLFPPPYTAVIVCVAADKAVVGKTELPLLRVLVPRTVMPS